jgi:RNA polymerase sigma-70 factor (ECF subfamily)
MSDAFLDSRSLLFGIAYRMLGRVVEAEDAVQDCYLRWQSQAATQENIRSPKAWLVATITRLCIDRLRSVQRQREEYVGAWLPEPLVGDIASAEKASATLADSLGTAFLLMLQTMTPDERAVFVLREAFDCDYREIGDIVGKSEANCRQIGRRAKEHLAQRPVLPPIETAQAETLVQQFLGAARDGDLSGLLSVLATDATITTDGGGRVRAAPQPISGAERIARFLLGIRPNIPVDADYRFAPVNGGCGVVVWSAGRPISVLTFDFSAGRIHAIYSVSNPDKLQHLVPGISPA